MYAVIFNGGKQYRVQPGDVVRLEKMPAEVGSQINFEQILMISEGETVQVGKPFLNGCSVEAEVTKQGRGKKIEIVKFRRRKHHEKWQGHRQDYTEVQIKQIKVNE